MIFCIEYLVCILFIGVLIFLFYNETKPPYQLVPEIEDLNQEEFEIEDNNVKSNDDEIINMINQVKSKVL